MGLYILSLSANTNKQGLIVFLIFSEWCSYAQTHFQVPQQRNGEECGNFVLYYINLFIESAPENFSISEGYPYFVSSSVSLLLCHFSEQGIIIFEWRCFPWLRYCIDEKGLVHSRRFGMLLQKIRLNLTVNSLGHVDARLYIMFCGESEEIQRNGPYCLVCFLRKCSGLLHRWN